MTKKPSVPERLRRQVQERAQGRCEYCLIHESDMYYPHEPDHVIAEKHGGATSLENLAWACFYCNRFKGSDLASVDPASRDPSSSSFIHVSRDGIAIFASMVV
jgi:5-methylcytosine-specific restriction endonuclease McrA